MKRNSAAKKETSSKKHRLRKVLLISGITLLLILIGLRIALPYIVLNVVNKKLQTIDGYNGHVNDIDIWLIRGAYQIKGIELNKTGGKIPVPFFSTEVLDISVEWKALFHGAIVAKIKFKKPVINFVKGPTEQTSQTKIDKSWIDVVNDLIPLKLNRIEIDSGEVHYRDYYSDPKINMFANRIYMLATNLSNSYHSKDSLPSKVTARANVYGGQMNFSMNLNPLNEVPIFDLKAQLTSLNLTNFNDFLLAYGKFDVKQGSISVYTEAATKNDEIVGYTKPIIKDLKVVDLQQDSKQPLHLIWESVMGLTAWILKNHPHDQLATKIEFEGSLKHPDTDIWSIVGSVLYNGFIQALSPSLENSISINKVNGVDNGEKNPEKKGFLHSIFGKKQK